MKKIQTALYLDPAVHGWATKRAAEDGRSLSQYIAKVLLDTSKVKPASNHLRPTARGCTKTECPLALI